MSPLYDFCCEKGHVTEVRAGRELQAMLCPTCGLVADRVAIYKNQYIIGETVAKGITQATRAGNIKDKHGRTRVSLFQEASQEIDYAHRKVENEVGHELPSPPLYQEAKKRASEIIEAT
jgi:hypothetical protein